MTDYVPFTYRITKAGDILISRDGRQVTTLRGATADRLAARLGDDEESDQALLQRALRPNPAGNADERTPLVLVRPA